MESQKSTNGQRSVPPAAPSGAQPYPTRSMPRATPPISGLPALNGYPPTAPALPEIDEVRAWQTGKQPAPPMGRMALDLAPQSPSSARPPAPTAAEAKTPPASDSRQGPTLTQQLAAIAPPDVAKQAIEELHILGAELSTLPDALVSSGLAKAHETSYRNAMLSYLALAQRAWCALAEERLEQRGAEPDYRAAAVELARSLRVMRQECDTAKAISEFQPAQRKPLFWRRRVALYRTGWRQWQPTVSSPPNPIAMGRALLGLRGQIGMASASGFELWLHDAIIVALHAAALVAGIGLLSLAVALGLAGNPLGLAANLGWLALVVVVWAVASALTVTPRVSLRVLLGASLFSPQRSVRHGRPGSGFLAGLFRVWHVFAGVTGLLGLVAAANLSVNTWLDAAQFFTVQNTSGQLNSLGTLLTGVGLSGGLSVLTTLGAIALPVVVTSVIRYIAELSGSMGWVPAARRYALAPAATVLIVPAAVSLVAYIASWHANLIPAPMVLFELAQFSLVTLHFTGIDFILTWRAIVLFGAELVVWLVCIGVPFRVGMLRWRSLWLQTLNTHRAQLGSHMRRLSLPDPNTGAQNTSPESLQAMEYDLVLDQYYRTQLDEAKRARWSPFGWGATVGLLVLAFLVAFGVDMLLPK